MVIRVTNENIDKKVVKPSTKQAGRKITFTFLSGGWKEEFSLVEDHMMQVFSEKPTQKRIDPTIIVNESASNESKLVTKSDDDDYRLLSMIEPEMEKHGIFKFISDNYDMTKESLIVIESDSDLVACQPWSRFIYIRSKVKTQQIRYIIKNMNSASVTLDDDLNILVLVSAAYKGYDGYPIGEKISSKDLPDEVLKIVERFSTDYKVPNVKPTIFTLAKFINEESVKKIEFNNYNFLHLLMHGSEGKLGFELTDNHSVCQWMSIEQCMPIFRKNDHKYKLVFLSLCDGARDNISHASLAYRLIKEGIAENVIGFNGSVGSNVTSIDFCDCFYKAYTESRDIERSYLESVDCLISKETQNYWFRPVLYTEKYES